MHELRLLAPRRQDGTDGYEVIDALWLAAMQAKLLDLKVINGAGKRL